MIFRMQARSHTADGIEYQVSVYRSSVFAWYRIVLWMTIHLKFGNCLTGCPAFRISAYRLRHPGDFSGKDIAVKYRKIQRDIAHDAGLRQGRGKSMASQGQTQIACLDAPR